MKARWVIEHSRELIAGSDMMSSAYRHSKERVTFEHRLNNRAIEARIITLSAMGDRNKETARFVHNQ
jgi:hypothetical protein